MIPPGIPNLDEKEEKSLLKKISSEKPSEKPLFNAENLTITDEGHVFITGSLNICKIVKDGDKYKLENIDIDTPNGSRNYFLL